jgi:RNA polymerase sigma-70 factor (ECF subfamily)
MQTLGENEFQQLLDRNYPKWIGIARTYASTSDRDDLLQEILVQVWRAAKTFRGDSHIDTWAYRVALNTALMWNRKTSRRHEHLPRGTIDAEQLAGTASAEAERRVLDEFMDSLTRVERAVFLLYLDDLPRKEAAAVVGMTEGTFRVRIHRLKKKFQDMFIQAGDSK